jgi:spoIIIJ-associated protein
MNKIEMQNLIKELIEKTTVEVSGISIIEDTLSSPQAKENSQITYFGVEVKEPHLFLGRGGEALFALNHLARKMIENKMSETENENGPEIMIDINGFQKKRIDNLRVVAHMMAERARYFKSNIEVDPMPAFERRIVHEFLSDALDLKTESVGSGLSRRVVIKYIGAI